MSWVSLLLAAWIIADLVVVAAIVSASRRRRHLVELRDARPTQRTRVASQLPARPLTR